MVNSPYVDASDEKKEVYKKILWYLLMKMKVLSENSRKLRGGTGENARGYLFENMDEIDIGALKRNTAREKQRADTAEKQVADERKQKEALEEVLRLRKMLESQEQK